jgi:multidrug resistance efflux pump
LLDQQHKDLELQINRARTNISDQFITYQSQFRATDLACRACETTIPAAMLERYKHHNATIDARKLALAEDALATAQNKLARLRLQLPNADLTGPRNAQITHHVHTLA